MKIEPIHISKVIEQNFANLMHDFYEMQTEYLASLKILYDDLDGALVAMVLTNYLYKAKTKDNDLKDLSVKNFYKKDFEIPVSYFKIKDVSYMLNLPRETVRRKKEKLINDKIIILDKVNKIYKLNTDLINKNIIDVQVYNLSKFLSRFSAHYSKNKIFLNELSKEDIKKDVYKKFLAYLTRFLDFQIAYFSNLKNYIDIESIFIVLLCSLNVLSKNKKVDRNLSFKEIFYKIHQLNASFGLNATSIADITKIPRTTVLRKVSNLEKVGLLKKDKFKRYTTDPSGFTKEGSKINTAVINSNIKLLSIFFSQCLETYTAKSSAI